MPITNKIYIFTQALEPSPVLVGRLINEHGVGTFEYAPSYLSRDDAYALDPINLELRSGTFYTKANQGVFNVLMDSTPDSWGKKLLNKIIDRPPRDNIELLLMATGGAGALLFSGSKTPDSARDHSAPFQIDTQDILWHLEHLESAADSMPAFLKAALFAGSSLGGARPKLQLYENDTYYIAKLNKNNDTINVCRVEASMLAQAKALGLNTPNFALKKLGDHDVLMVERFDRTLKSRLHYISAHSLLNGDKFRDGDEAKHISYGGIAEVIRKICAEPKETCLELYKRAALNIIVGNTDDHLKNHGFLLKPKANYYELSPLFDVVPQVNQTRLQAIGIGHSRTSELSELLVRSSDFYLTREEATEVIQKLAVQVKEQLPSIMQEHGVPESDARLVMRIVSEKVGGLNVNSLFIPPLQLIRG